MSIEEPMSIEDLVRTATRAGATLVRDIRPLAAPEPARLRRRPAPSTRRWISWTVPLAAAAAVALVAVGLVAVRSVDSGAPAAHPATPAASATVPRYFAVLDEQETAAGNTVGSGAVIVGDDVAGQTIATVNPPRGMQFQTVEGGSDDRAFVLVARSKASGLPPDTWYLLRIAPGTAHAYQLAELPIKLPSSSSGELAYALSPDGRELAVESMVDAGIHGVDSVVTLGVYSVPSGAELRAWTTRKIAPVGDVKETLSWLAGGRQLAFSDTPSGGPVEDQLRTLDLTGSGTDLMAASRAVLTVKIPGSSASTCWTMRLTPDGGTVICSTQFAYLTGPTVNAGCADGLKFTAYSARTGKPERVLYQYRAAGSCHNGLTDVLWSDSSASSIVGATEINLEDQGGQQSGQLGVITDGHLRPLKLPKSVSPLDDLVIAF